MTPEEIFAKLKPVIADSLSIAESEITEDKKLTDLGADSLDAVNTIMEIEKAFDIAIPDSDMDKLISIKDIIDYISEHTKS